MTRFSTVSLILGVILSIGLFAASGFIIFRVYRLVNPYLDREITGPVTVTPQWLEIVPKEPLRPERYKQHIVLDIEYPIKPDESAPLGENEPTMGLVLPDGSITVPEVQLVDQDGNVYKLNSPSTVISPSKKVWKREFGTIDPLPKDKVYRTVRIRSDKSFPVLKVYWRCYNPWDKTL